MPTTATATVDRHFPARTGYAIKLIHEAIADVHETLEFLSLCTDAPRWPDTASLSTWQAPQWVAVADQFRSHTADACACNPHHRRQAADLIGAWLDLWTLAMRHIECPERYDRYIVLRALYLVRDLAEFILTGEPFPVLNYDPLAPVDDNADLPLWQQTHHEFPAGSHATDSGPATVRPAHHGQGEPPF